MTGRGHRLLPHTADMGIEAWAERKQGLFITAAQGLREMLFGRAPIGTQEQAAVTLDMPDDAELLVSWLNEILYRFEVDELVPAEFRVDTLNNGHLEAVIRGERYDPARHPLQRQVKAVTYHQLTLEQQPAGWYAKVYVDL